MMTRHSRPDIQKTTVDDISPAEIFVPVTAETLKSILAKTHLSVREQVSILKNIIDINEPELTQERLDRLNEILKTAAQTFVTPAREYAEKKADEQTSNNDPEKITARKEALKKLEQAVMDFYAIVMPSVHPDENPWILEVENRTGLKNTSRKGRVWNSQPQDRRYIVLQELFNQLESTDPAIKKQAEFLIRDIESWAGPLGLVSHTAAVSWAVEHYAHNIQTIVAENKKHQGFIKDPHSKEAQDMACELDPDLMRVWMLFHDGGRFVTQDSFDHADFSKFFVACFNLPNTLAKDPDLPTILLFNSRAPAVLPPQLRDIPDGLTKKPADTLSPEEKEELATINEQNRVARIEFVDDILKQLPKQSEHEFFSQDKNFNPLSVVLFWYLDAYTKLLDLREIPGTYFTEMKRDENSVTKPQLYNQYGDRIGKDRTGMPITTNLHNRQPGDEKYFLMSRITHYIPSLRESLVITPETIDSAGLNPSDTEKAHYYLRQLELAHSIYEWLQERLELSSQQVWTLFFNTTDVSRHMLNGKRLFQYTHFPADISWKEDPLKPKFPLK